VLLDILGKFFTDPRLPAELHNTYARLLEGSVATYIPELAKADPHWFGIALVYCQRVGL